MKLIIGRGTWYKKVAQMFGDGWTIQRSLAPQASVIVNFGLVGQRFQDKFGAYLPYVKQETKLINFNLPVNKYKACLTLRDHIPVPQVIRNLEEVNAISEHSIDDVSYLIKPVFSIGGKNITLLSSGVQLVPPGFYVQKKINNRRYELRVHCFDWISPDKWLVYKRTHPEGEAALTWNHKTGGIFSQVTDESNAGLFKRAKQSASLALEKLGVNFGAVDFIVSNDDDPLIPWFVEINFSPGMKIPNVKEAYTEAFNQL